MDEEHNNKSVTVTTVASEKGIFKCDVSVHADADSVRLDLSNCPERNKHYDIKLVRIYNFFYFTININIIFSQNFEDSSVSSGSSGNRRRGRPLGSVKKKEPQKRLTEGSAEFREKIASAMEKTED